MEFDLHNAARTQLPVAAAHRRRSKSRRGMVQFFRPRVEQLESRQMLSADLDWVLPDLIVDEETGAEVIVADCYDQSREKMDSIDFQADLQQDSRRADATSHDEVDQIEVKGRACDIDFILSSASGATLNFDAVSGAINLTDVTNNHADETNDFEMSLTPTDGNAETTEAPGSGRSDSIDIGPLATHVVVIPYRAVNNSTVVTKGVAADLSPGVYQPVTPAPALDQASHPRYFAAPQSLTAARWQVGSEPDVGSTGFLDVAGPDDLQGRRVVRLAASKIMRQATLIATPRTASHRLVRLAPVTMSPARAEFVSAVFATAESWLREPPSDFQAKLFPVSLWPAEESSAKSGPPSVEGQPENSPATSVSAPHRAAREVLRDPEPPVRPVAFVGRPESSSARALSGEES